MDWRELHLSRRSRVFNFAHRWLKVIAIVVGFPMTVVSLMAVAGRFTGLFEARLAVALVIALVFPAIIARLLRPSEDPLVAVGLPSETYAWLLLGFAALFVVGLHTVTAPLLVREGDRDACAGVWEMARGAWFLGGVRTKAATRDGAPPCSAMQSR
jgi:hypothetical protein